MKKDEIITFRYNTAEKIETVPSYVIRGIYDHVRSDLKWSYFLSIFFFYLIVVTPIVFFICVSNSLDYLKSNCNGSFHNGHFVDFECRTPALKELIDSKDIKE